MNRILISREINVSKTHLGFVHTIPDSFWAATKIFPDIEGFCSYTENSDFGWISMTERSCTAPISKLERLLSDRLCASLWCSVSTYSDRRGSKRVGVRTGMLCTKPSRPTAPARGSMCVNDLCRPGPLLFILYWYCVKIDLQLKRLIWIKNHKLGNRGRIIPVLNFYVISINKPLPVNGIRSVL